LAAESVQPVLWADRFQDRTKGMPRGRN
jgi:hypothetical protein